MNKPKALVFDIETSPLLGYVWSLWDQNVALNQIHSDWYVLSWSAKWLGDPESKIMYADQRDAPRIEDDKALLRGLWKLLDEADIVITQNGKAFDQKKLNARFVLHGFQPPSNYKHIDTLLLAKKHFAFTSNKLEYMTDKLCTKYKKLKSKKFPGFELWSECMKGNPEAWKEMERYNKHDVLSLEELYTKLIPWDNNTMFSLYGDTTACSCGHTQFKRRGYYYTNTGKYARFKCKSCGSEQRSRKNLFSAAKKASIKGSVVR